MPDPQAEYPMCVRTRTWLKRYAISYIEYSKWDQIAYRLRHARSLYKMVCLWSGLSRQMVLWYRYTDISSRQMLGQEGRGGMGALLQITLACSRFSDMWEASSNEKPGPNNRFGRLISPWFSNVALCGGTFTGSCTRFFFRVINTAFQ